MFPSVNLPLYILWLWRSQIQQLVEKEAGQGDKEQNIISPVPCLSSSHELSLTLNRGVWSLDVGLGWAFYSGNWNSSDTSKWLEKALESSSNIIQEVGKTFLQKYLWRKNDSYLYSLKPNDKNNLSQLTKSTRRCFHIIQPKVSSMQVNWLEEAEKQQGFTQTWQVHIGC